MADAIAFAAESAKNLAAGWLITAESRVAEL
jgi:hypothetical protein